MKLDKSVIDRRVKLMEDAGIKFVTNADIGKTIMPADLEKEYDSIILACGASNPRDINVPGRDAKGIYFAVDFLTQVTKRLLDSDFNDVPKELAEGKDVIKHLSLGDSSGTCIKLQDKAGCAQREAY